MELQAFSPNVKVIGGVINAFIQAFSQPDLARSILKKHGIDDVKDSNWYPQQDYFESFRELETIIGNLMLQKIGTKIVENARLEVAGNIFDFFEKIGSSYRMNHQNDNMSYYKVIEKGTNHILIETNNPYPDSFDRGLYEGFARKFVSNPKVETTERGMEKRTYMVRW
jgi:hypothetical protein